MLNVYTIPIDYDLFLEYTACVVRRYTTINKQCVLSHWCTIWIITNGHYSLITLGVNKEDW